MNGPSINIQEENLDRKQRKKQKKEEKKEGKKNIKEKTVRKKNR